MVACTEITPSVVNVGNKLCAACVIDCNNISLQILLKEIRIPYVFRIACRVVLHTYNAACVVEVEGNISVCFLAYYLTSVKIIGGFYFVYGLGAADAVCIVSKVITVIVTRGFNKLPAKPRKRVSVVILQRVAYFVIVYSIAFIRGEKISPLGICVGIYRSGYRAGREVFLIRKYVRQLIKYITRVIVGIDISLTRCRIVLADKLSEVIVSITVGYESVYVYARNIAVRVIGVGVVGNFIIYGMLATRNFKRGFVSYFGKVMLVLNRKIVTV